MYQHDFVNNRVDINDPIKMANSSGFLWNENMMIHMNCRGYAVSQFMQPEPSKYSHSPNMAAKSFMQPEQSYFTHHAGRFFYIKCLDTDELFSIPYEPVRQPLDTFNFSVGQHNIVWHIQHCELEIQLSLTLPTDDTVELWELEIINHSAKPRTIAVYPYFSVGYMSWMNQSATFEPTLNGIVASSITPYQHVGDYFKNKSLKDKTFLISKEPATSWCANQAAFEGEGGLHNPDGIKTTTLAKTSAQYQTPVACLQFNHSLDCQQQINHQFIFGPAINNQEITQIKQRYFGESSALQNTKNNYQQYVAGSKSCIEITSPDKEFNQFVNYWLPRQVFYHGDTQRLTTDPQTRNYLQDAMGMAYINPDKTRDAIITASAQQFISGAMPDGILLHQDASLKYINLVPHSDHGIWLTLCLKCYLDETNDRTILFEKMAFTDSEQAVDLISHINMSLDYLLNARDDRGLSYIEQGDWCDPMNMVGYKGKGVSAWLTVATAYSLKVWCDICQTYQINSDHIARYSNAVNELNDLMNQYYWDGDWYARGINDDGIKFGVSRDEEGKIYLNPQTWALLSGAANQQQQNKMLSQVDNNLLTPFGIMMLAPSYTRMNEHVGRLTQKFPGVAENGSVYNHAAAFYCYSLFQINQADRAFNVLKKMLPTSADALERQQLPTFIPNYYRGAYFQLPEVAGRSSQLFNTGTVAWYLRCIVEGLCGLQGQGGSLKIVPNIPSSWSTMSATRQYMGATFNVTYTRSKDNASTLVNVDGSIISGNVISNITAGKTYNVIVNLASKE